MAKKPQTLTVNERLIDAIQDLTLAVREGNDILNEIVSALRDDGTTQAQVAALKDIALAIRSGGIDQAVLDQMFAGIAANTAGIIAAQQEKPK